MTEGEQDAIGAGKPRALRILAQLVATAVVTILVFRALGGTIEDALALDRAFARPRVLPLVLSTALLLFGYAFAARMWGWMLTELGTRDPGVGSSIRLVLAANLGRYVPGKIWQIAGLAVLAKRRGIPATSAGTALVLVQGFTLAATAIWGLPLLFADAGESAPVGSAFGLWTTGILLVLVGMASIPALTGAGTRLLFRVTRRDPAEAPRPGPGFGPKWLLVNLFAWGVYGASFLLFIVGLGFAVPPVVAMSAFAAAYLIGNLFVAAPAGVGIREVALTGFLLPHIGAAAMPVAIVTRLWMTGAEVIPAGVFAWIELRDTTA